MRLTDAEIAAMPPKSLKHPEVVQIYLDHDYLEAYALHTDKRIFENGYKAAVGSGDNWDSHGDLQRDFLIKMGLRPQHHLLEIGCGTGRLARKVTAYLEVGHYVGVDISLEAIRASLLLSGVEGWTARDPRFYQHDVPPEARRPFDVAWAFSVFIHLPPDEIGAVMRRVGSLLAPAGRFYWSFTAEQKNWRSGLKQFRATVESYRKFAKRAGLSFELVPDWIKRSGYVAGRWSGGQQVAVSRRLDAAR